MRLLDSFPRVSLAYLPTPLEEAPRLASAMGVRRLWVKRDDCTGLAMGGNKARKLEFLVADALRAGADTLLTTGGVQSNHARMTAAAACKHGLRCLLFLSDEEPPAAQGNLLLDRLFGASVRFMPAVTLAEQDAAMAEAAAELAARGQKGYIIPVGGSTPLGCLGYVSAVRELAEQAAAQGCNPAAMALAVGSCGTLAGVLLGAAEWLPGCRIFGISVSRPAGGAAAQTARIATEAAQALAIPRQWTVADILVSDEWLGPGYGVATAEGSAAVRLAARTEGLVLDPVYTGKALAGLIGLVRRGEIAADGEVLFWHTGGAPAIFARPEVVESE